MENFRSSVIERRRDTTTLAAALYRALLSEVDLAPAQRLFVVPHGPLHYLPFQIERSAITVWPSAAVGSRLLARGAAPAPQLLGFGNPSTDKNVPLPGAEREVQQVARLFPRSEVFLQAEAMDFNAEQ